MSSVGKQLSNPYSTGGGGINFETRVQTFFAVLMLAGGVVPCLPPWPIIKIKLQGKYIGYETDDFIVFVKESNSDREAKLLAQIKHSISITESDTVFAEVINAAWRDFSNPNLFTPGKDAIALITGPLSASDIESARRILELARDSEDANEFINKIELAKFSSNAQREKLKAFRFHLGKAKGSNVLDDELWRFLKHFYLLGYDLDTKTGVMLSLAQTLIGQYSPDNPQNLWSRILNEVQSANQNAGTLSRDNLSSDIVAAFSKRILQTIPPEFVKREEISVVSDLAKLPHPAEFAIAVLLGGWNESSAADKAIIERLSGMQYTDWIAKMRDILLQPGSPLTLKDAAWTLPDRRAAWYAVGARVFDDHLDRLKEVAAAVFSERDPQFELPADERYAARFYGKSLNHSDLLRRGLAETLALLGSQPRALSSCTFRKPEDTAVLVVREILGAADWVLWASLNELLPLLAEAAPGEFLDAVESALSSRPSSFDRLFAQESGSPITGWNYMSGLLSALETLAWDAEHLTRIVVILGELAARDPGGSWSNRPANSLVTILLPWLPQTIAAPSKRKTAIEILVKELPSVAWKLLLDLLPSSHQISIGSRKPEWRSIIPDDFPRNVTNEEYRDQVNAYAELAIRLANQDVSKLAELIDRANDLPSPALDQLLTQLRSDTIVSMPEADRLPLWTALADLVIKHRKYADAEWAMKPERLKEIEEAAEKLAPSTPMFRHQRLFTERDFDLYEEKGSYQEQQKELDERRQKAVLEVFAVDGLEGVLNFAKSVESPWRLGFGFGAVAASDCDEKILPALLNSDINSLERFAAGFVWARFRNLDWKWVDQIDTSKWSAAQIGQFLTYLPFNKDTWDRLARLLSGNEAAYWSKATVNPYDAGKDIQLAVDRLLEHGRPQPAIRCLEKLIDHKEPLDSQQAVRVLKAILGSAENLRSVDVDAIIEVIQALQNDPNANTDDLFQIEWAYLPLLDRIRGASARTIEQRLADDPAFFCEIIRLVYRSESDTEKSSAEEPTEQSRDIIRSAYRLLMQWRTPPGRQKDGTFDGALLSTWLQKVKVACAESGHLKSALRQIGHVFVYAPADPDGLWLHRSVATALNEKDAEDIRQGFTTELFNLRGVHSWTAGREERELSAKYRDQAEKIESAGFQRLATALKELAASYERDAERQATKDPLDH
jgi:hypothetical protein